MTKEKRDDPSVSWTEKMIWIFLFQIVLFLIKKKKNNNNVVVGWWPPTSLMDSFNNWVSVVSCGIFHFLGKSIGRQAVGTGGKRHLKTYTPPRSHPFSQITIISLRCCNYRWETTSTSYSGCSQPPLNRPCNSNFLAAAILATAFCPEIE